MRARCGPILGLVVICVLVSIGGMAYGDLLFNGFENPPYTTGSISGQDGWGMPMGAVTIINTAAHTGTQSVKIGTGNNAAQHNINVLAGPGDSISFWINPTFKNEDGFGGVEFNLKPGGGGMNFQGGLVLRYNSVGDKYELFAREGFDLIDTGLDIGYIPLGSWYNFKMVNEGATYGVYYGESKYGSYDLGGAVGAISLEGMALTSGTALFDDVSVAQTAQTPEPSTMFMFVSSLLGLGWKMKFKFLK